MNQLPAAEVTPCAEAMSLPAGGAFVFVWQAGSHSGQQLVRRGRGTHVCLKSHLCNNTSGPAAAGGVDVEDVGCACRCGCVVYRVRMPKDLQLVSLCVLLDSPRYDG
jgi:hypothetical protein